MEKMIAWWFALALCAIAPSAYAQKSSKPLMLTQAGIAIDVAAGDFEEGRWRYEVVDVGGGRTADMLVRSRGKEQAIELAFHTEVGIRCTQWTVKGLPSVARDKRRVFPKSFSKVVVGPAEGDGELRAACLDIRRPEGDYALLALVGLPKDRSLDGEVGSMLSKVVKGDRSLVGLRMSSEPGLVTPKLVRSDSSGKLTLPMHGNVLQTPPGEDWSALSYALFGVQMDRAWRVRPNKPPMSFLFVVADPVLIPAGQSQREAALDEYENSEKYADPKKTKHVKAAPDGWSPAIRLSEDRGLKALAMTGLSPDRKQLLKLFLRVDASVSDKDALAAIVDVAARWHQSLVGVDTQRLELRRPPKKLSQTGLQVRVDKFQWKLDPLPKRFGTDVLRLKNGKDTATVVLSTMQFPGGCAAMLKSAGAKHGNDPKSAEPMFAGWQEVVKIREGETNSWLACRATGSVPVLVAEIEYSKNMERFVATLVQAIAEADTTRVRVSTTEAPPAAK